MPEKLFSDFAPISSKQWKQQIQYEQKGADYNELVWESPEGIKVKPFYQREDLTELFSLSHSGGFSIAQEIFVFDVAKSAARAVDSVNRGAEEIRFIIPDGNIDLDALVERLPQEVPVYFEFRFQSRDIAKKLAQISQNRNIYALVDPIHKLAADGNWFEGSDNFEVLKDMLSANYSGFSIDGRFYQNAGANIVQQLAYTLAHATEYFNHCGDPKNDVVIQMSVGSNYFFEIAKLRAIRLLYSAVAKKFGFTSGLRLIVQPTKRNKTLYDYNVNMLRTTTECMSAALGGADSIANLPYDEIYHKSNEFGERIARNQLLILKHESYFDKTGNAAEGSYYIESLTGQLAEKALVLFKEIESAGGFLKLLKDGVIQKKISDAAAKEQALFDSGAEILVGTNKYINKNDRMHDDLELFPFVKVKPRKTLVRPIIEKRLSENSEQERLEAEKSNIL